MDAKVSLLMRLQYMMGCRYLYEVHQKVFMRSLKCFFGVLLLAIITSCGKTSVITYSVKNNTSDSIMIVTSRVPDTTYRPDTMFLSYNQEVVVLVNEPGKLRVNEYKELGAELKYLYRIDAYRLSRNKPSVSLRSVTRWRYEEMSNKIAKYNTVVTDVDYE